MTVEGAAARCQELIRDGRNRPEQTAPAPRFLNGPSLRRTLHSFEKSLLILSLCIVFPIASIPAFGIEDLEA